MGSNNYIAVPDVVERLCGGCEQVKPMRKRKQRCDDCAGTSKPAEVEIEPEIEIEIEQAPHEVLLSRAPSLGFELVLQEGDFVLEQHTDERGTQTIWLSPDEAYDAATKILAALDRREVVLSVVPSIADLEAA